MSHTFLSTSVLRFCVWHQAAWKVQRYAAAWQEPGGRRGSARGRVGVPRYFWFGVDEEEGLGVLRQSHWEQTARTGRVKLTSSTRISSSSFESTAITNPTPVRYWASYKLMNNNKRLVGSRTKAEGFGRQDWLHTTRSARNVTCVLTSCLMRSALAIFGAAIFLAPPQKRSEPKRSDLKS